jgi:hypothetical protein
MWWNLLRSEKSNKKFIFRTMTKKIFNLFVLSILILNFVACGNRTKEIPEAIQCIYSIYGTPGEVGDRKVHYLPIELFWKNGEFYAHYIRNGKSLDDIKLKYHNSKKEEYSTIFCFDEIIDDKKTGQYNVTNNDFFHITYIDKDGKKYPYEYCDVVLKSDVWNTDNIEAAEKKLSEMKPDEFGSEETYAKKIQFLIKSNPATLDYPFNLLAKQCSLEMETSDDGNLRFYNQHYYLGGNGHGNFPQIVMAQFRNGENVYLIEDFMDTYIDNIVYANFFHTNSIKIHTLSLKNKTYYLTDISVYDEMPATYGLNDDYDIELGTGGGDDNAKRSNGNILRLYSIENGELIAKKLFKTPKEILSEITIDFDGTKEWNGDTDFAWNLFKYESKSKTIFVPVIDNNSHRITNKYLLYQWDGKYFTYRGIAK